MPTHITLRVSSGRDQRVQLIFINKKHAAFSGQRGKSNYFLFLVGSLGGACGCGSRCIRRRRSHFFGGYFFAPILYPGLITTVEKTRGEVIVLHFFIYFVIVPS